MKKYILAIIVLASCFACQPTEDEKAAPLMKKIETLYHDGQYQAALNAITQLRAQHPRAIKSRQRALVIWQDASLKMTQQDSCTTETKQAIVDGPTLQSDRGWRVKPFLCSSYQLYSCYSQGQRGLFIEEKLLM